MHPEIIKLKNKTKHMKNNEKNIPGRLPGGSRDPHGAWFIQIYIIGLFLVKNLTKKGPPEDSKMVDKKK